MNLSLGRTTPQLLRQFIHERLYNAAYFERVRILQPRLRFTELADQAAYERAVAECYAQTGGQAWHTPSELFSPHYGRGIAEWILTRHVEMEAEEPVCIYEVGPGNGTLARDIIGGLQEAGVEKLEYHGIEISPNLAKVQQTQLADLIQARSYRPHLGSMLDWRKPVHGPVYVLGLEVLDNLPHDLIRFNGEGMLEQATILDGQIMWNIATDPLIIRLCNLLERMGWQWPCLRPRSSRLQRLFSSLLEPSEPEAEWIPTGAFQLLSTISQYFPRAQLFLSDFASLPETLPWGHGSPLVQTRLPDGRVQAANTLFKADGNYDIMFPTSFPQLALIWRFLKMPQLSTLQVKSHPAWFQEWAEWEHLNTQSGWNPLLRDFTNVQVMTALL